MSPELKRFLEEKKEQMPPNWEKETQARELGMWAPQSGAQGSLRTDAGERLSREPKRSRSKPLPR